MKWYEYIITRFRDYKWWVFAPFAVILLMAMISIYIGSDWAKWLTTAWVACFCGWLLLWIIATVLYRRNFKKAKSRGEMKAKVVISRKYDKMQTTGRLVAFAGDQKLYECVTIELPNNGNEPRTSCIPEGTYDCEKIYSPTKGLCFSVRNVPGRTNILIHIGNYAAGEKIDTEGCILPGRYFYDLNKDGYIDVAESTKAMNKLLSLLPGKFKLYII